MTERQNSIERFLAPKQTPTRKTNSKRQRSSPEVVEPNKKQQNKINNMAEAPVGNMSLPVLMEAIGGMMDRKLADVAKIGDLKDLGEKLDKIKEENEALKVEVQTIKTDYSDVKEQLEEIDNYNRRKNLIFIGITEVNHENWECVVKEVCKKTLGIEQEIRTERGYVFDMGKTKTKAIFVELTSFDITQKILKNCFKLKGSNITILQDYSFEWRQQRRKLLAIKREILRSSKEHRVSVRGKWLHLDGERMMWSKTGGGLLGGRDGRQDGFQIIKSITGMDLSHLGGQHTSKDNNREKQHRNNN